MIRLLPRRIQTLTTSRVGKGSKMQFSQAKVERAVRDYKSGVPVYKIAKRFHVAEGTMAAVLRGQGLDLNQNERPRYVPSPEEIEEAKREIREKNLLAVPPFRPSEFDEEEDW